MTYLVYNGKEGLDGRGYLVEDRLAVLFHIKISDFQSFFVVEVFMGLVFIHVVIQVSADDQVRQLFHGQFLIEVSTLGNTVTDD